LRYFGSAGYIVNKTRSFAEHREHTHVSAGLVPLTLKFQFSIHINNFELTGDPFKLVKLYNLCSLFKLTIKIKLIVTSPTFLLFVYIALW